MQVLEYHDILHCFVIFVNMADEHSRLIGVELHNLCVYTVYDGEFKMRHNFILLLTYRVNYIIFLLSIIMLYIDYYKASIGNFHIKFLSPGKTCEFV